MEAEEFEEKKKRQKRSLAYGFLALIVIIGLGLCYRYYLQLKEEYAKESIVVKPNYTSKVETKEVNKDLLLDVQTQKRIKDSIAQISNQATDTANVLNKVAALAGLKSDEPGSKKQVVEKTKQVAKAPEPTLIASTRPVPRKEVYTKRKPVVKKVSIGGKVKKSTSQDEGFNFVYNENLKADAQYKPASHSTLSKNKNPEYASFSPENQSSRNGADERASTPGIIAGKQKISNGEAVSIRLSEDLKIGNAIVNKGTIVSGQALINGERVQITVRNVKVNGELVRTNLKVIGADMIDGIKAIVKTEVDASSSTNAVVNEIGNQLGVVGRVLTGVRVNRHKSYQTEYYIQDGTKLFLIN